MVEAKCDLYSVLSTKADLCNKAWWKERLKNKYIRSLEPIDKGRFWDINTWTFIKNGLDDFRDGLPSVYDEDIFIKGEHGLGPNITNDVKSICSSVVAKKRLPKRTVYFSKKTPQQEQRLLHINQIEAGLKGHPLALYSHLEESIPPEMFEDVVEILDPEMHEALNEKDLEQKDNSDDNTGVQVPDEEEQQPLEPSDEITKKKEVERNPYRWIPRIQGKEKKEKKTPVELHKHMIESEDDNIRQVTREFCNWVASIGGESNNIEESTVVNLFASGYETKPALSVPIQVVELTNIPPELRTSSAQPEKKCVDSQDQLQLPDNYVPSWIKFKYGAWYLKPKTWRVRLANEPLTDPRDTSDKEFSETKKKSLNLDYDLATMHGTKLFTEFVNKKATRKPEFVQHIAQIRSAQAQAKEEEARNQMEYAKKKSLSVSTFRRQTAKK